MTDDIIKEKINWEFQNKRVIYNVFISSLMLSKMTFQAPSQISRGSRVVPICRTPIKAVILVM